MQNTETIHTRCCITGGGPAGIMLGYLLARAGIDVVVLEKWADFFRDFRGDTIHPSTMEVLYELGLLDDFLKLPHSQTRQMVGYIGGRETQIADFTRLNARCPFIAFIPQWDFLNFLTEKAKAFPTFHMMMETEAIDVIEENDKVIGVRAKNKHAQFDILADLTIGADGRHSTIRNKARLTVNDLGAPIDVLWFRVPREDKSVEQSFGHIDRGKVLVTLNRGDYWQCAFVIAKGHFENIKSHGIGEFRNDIAMFVPFLASAISEVQDWEQVKLLSVKVDRLTTWYRDGVLCIGDSAHAMSPLGGVGINLAIQDAVAAGNILAPAFQNGKPSKDVLAKVQQRREWPAKLTQRLQILIHHGVLAPVFKQQTHIDTPMFVRLLGAFPPLQWIPARLVGVGFRPEHVRIAFRF